MYSLRKKNNIPSAQKCQQEQLICFFEKFRNGDLLLYNNLRNWIHEKKISSCLFY